MPTQVLARPSARMVAAHAALAETEDYADRFTFAFVRHPLSWWRALWAHRMRAGWHPAHEIDSRVRSGDFNEFISLVVARLPGHLNERFCRYVGPPGRPIEFVGRYESLVDDLVQALRLAGEELDETALRRHPPANIGDYDGLTAVFEAESAALLAESEREVIDRFYPGAPPARFAPIGAAREQAA